MKRIVTVILIAFCSLACFSQEAGTFKDSRDGRIYKTVMIGTQIWMAENLAYKTDSGYWAYKDDTSNVAIYGYLYDWNTAKKACPSGWHLPSFSELETLYKYLVGGNDKTLEDKLQSMESAAAKLKSVTGWNKNRSGGTNISGFTALPGGFRTFGGAYEFIGGTCFFWTSDEWVTSIVYCGYLTSNFDIIRQTDTNALSVRCIKD
jgi:uncharacterized protein (TIGR02145 family)